MAEREKIIEILKQTSDIWKEEERYGYIVSVDLEKIAADALIAAGIGDVKEAKFESDHYRRMWQGALVELKQAEHRAEVAERAFDNTMKVFHEILSAIFPDTKIDLDAWKKQNLANAEKELAEERKDG